MKLEITFDEANWGDIALLNRIVFYEDLIKQWEQEDDPHQIWVLEIREAKAKIQVLKGLRKKFKMVTKEGIGG